MKCLQNSSVSIHREVCGSEPECRSTSRTWLCPSSIVRASDWVQNHYITISYARSRMHITSKIFNVVSSFGPSPLHFFSFFGGGGWPPFPRDRRHCWRIKSILLFVALSGINGSHKTSLYAVDAVTRCKRGKIMQGHCKGKGSGFI